MSIGPSSDSEHEGNAVGAANAAAAQWCLFRDTLAPVLGQGGVAALYRRTLKLAGRKHPCLLQAVESTSPVTFEKLREVLSAEHAKEAIAATDASLRTFHELLIYLIGVSLTDQLLGGAWSHLFSELPTQDKLT